MGYLQPCAGKRKLLGALLLTAPLLACSSSTEGNSSEVEVGPRWPQALEQWRIAKEVPEMPPEEPRALVPKSQSMEYTARCWRELGYEVHEIEGGGIHSPVGSLEETNKRAYMCLARYPDRRDVIQSNLTDEQLAIHYEWTTDRIIPCIEELGLPAKEAPTVDEFIATYRQDEPLWFPGDYGDEDLDLIQSSCDLLPPWSKLGLDE